MDICPDMIKFDSCKSSQLELLMAQTIIMSLENFTLFFYISGKWILWIINKNLSIGY